MNAQSGLLKAVVDTGPLFNALVIGYCQSKGKKLPLSRASISLSPEEQEDYLLILESIAKPLTTSHVIGEVQGLTQRLKFGYAEQKDFWGYAVGYLTQRGFDEQLVRLFDLSSEDRTLSWLCRVGPTDSGLIELALREGCVLLTEDLRTLARLAWEIGVDCKPMSQLLDSDTEI